MPAIRKLIAEFLGAYVLLGMGGFAIFAANRGNGVGADGPLPQGTPVLVIALGFGLALLVGLYAFGEVSGGHYNPAVSLGVLLDGRIDVVTFVTYAIAQIGGAVAAGYTLVYAFSIRFVASTATIPNEALRVTDTQALVLEALFTAFFVAVILKVTASKGFGATAFLAISLTLVVIHLGLVPITGSSVNPARTLGSAIAGQEYTSLWVYMVGPLVGAAVGWGFFKAVTTGEEDAA
ncbi:MAG: aquaporin [Actinomycetota bacterium]